MGVTIARLEWELVSDSGELYPLVREMLTRVRTLVSQMAICSNGTQGYVERVIDAHRLRVFFDVIRYRRSSQDDKPFMVRELLRRSGSSTAVVIGDRRDDIEAAHQNGIPAVAATYGYGSEAELESADAAAASPSVLPDLVTSLLANNPRCTVGNCT